MSDKFIKPKSRYNHFKSEFHENFDKCKHMELNLEHPKINDVDRDFYGYNIQHKKEYKYYLIKCHFKFHAVVWKLNAMINKNKNLIDKFNRNWRHPLNRKFES